MKNEIEIIESSWEWDVVPAGTEKSRGNEPRAYEDMTQGDFNPGDAAFALCLIAAAAGGIFGALNGFFC